MRRFASFLLLLMAAGCALLPYHPRPIEPARLSEQIESRSLDSAELQKFLSKRIPASASEWPLQSWDFGALAIAADYFNPELDLARKKWATADAAVTTASQRPNPSIVLPLEFGTGIPEDEKPWTLGLGIDIPVETAGKRGYRMVRAAHLSESARQQIGATAWKVRTGLRTALLELHLSRQRSELLQKQVDNHEKIVHLLERRRREGAASGPEVDQQRMLLAARLAERNSAEQARTVVMANIAETIGVPVTEIERIGMQLNLDEFQSIHMLHVSVPDHGIHRRALLNRPELRAALAEYEASQAALQLQVARQYPNLTLGPGYTWDAGAHRFSFGAGGIELPLFHRNEGPIAEAEAARNEAASVVAQVQARILHEMDRALAAHRAAHARLAEADRLLAQEQRRVAAVRRSFDAGQTDRLELTMAEQTLYSHLLVHDETVAQAKRAAVVLKSALPDLRLAYSSDSDGPPGNPAASKTKKDVNEIQ